MLGGFDDDDEEEEAVLVVQRKQKLVTSGMDFSLLIYFFSLQPFTNHHTCMSDESEDGTSLPV